MRHTKLAGVVLVTAVLLGFAAPRPVLAGPFSLHPSACVLARNSSPFDAISGATYANATFTNSSGGTALAYCPMPFQNGFSSFKVATTSTATTCTLQTISNAGGVSVVFGSHSGNIWTFTTTLNPGTYAAQVACPLANGTGIYHLVNF